MRPFVHIILEIIILVSLTPFLGFPVAIVISLSHFIPSIDWAMKHLNILPHLHRKLFHNVWVIIIVSLIVYFYFGILISVLAMLNMVFHIFLDLAQKDSKAIVIFFPASKYKLKLR